MRCKNEQEAEYGNRDERAQLSFATLCDVTAKAANGKKGTAEEYAAP